MAAETAAPAVAVALVSAPSDAPEVSALPPAGKSKGDAPQVSAGKCSAGSSDDPVLQYVLREWDEVP